MHDDAHSGGGDAFTIEEQAAWDAQTSEGPAQEPAGGEAPPAEEPAAPAAPDANAAPGDVVDDPDAEDSTPEQNRGKFVRHGAFHAERERRKAAERRAADLEEKFLRGDERMRLLTQAMQAQPQAQRAGPPAAPEKVPDPSEDIFGYVKHLEKQLSALASGQQQVTQQQQEMAAQRRAAEERDAVVGAYQQDIQRFAAGEPTFGEAYRFLIEGRVAELKLYGLDERQAIAQANADEEAFVRSALQRGFSPAEQAFVLAKARGYVGKPSAPAAPAAPAESPAERQARLAAGQAASRSLSAAGGGPAGEVTLEMLASMSEADFEKFAAKNPAKLARLMGEAA